MKVVALISGGKDSCYSILKCQENGHEVVALANLHPEKGAPDELDSFCFQTVGHSMVDLYPSCTGLPLYRLQFTGNSTNRELSYSESDGDEVEDLRRLLAFVKADFPGLGGVASGAIASDYQRLRVEHVCSSLRLTSLAYLWHQPQIRLLQVRSDVIIYIMMLLAYIYIYIYSGGLVTYHCSCLGSSHQDPPA
jgi:diphthine-ammonia ligase